MLDHHLDSAIENLQSLIEMTRQDIEAIKAAKHQEMFDRIQAKERALVAFENHKTSIDTAIMRIAQAHPQDELETLLSTEAKRKLSVLKERLLQLQELNRRFAKFVVSVGEFYNTLFEKMLPVEKDGYDKKGAKIASLIEVRV